MNSNYLWRSKWENQWRAVVGKEEFRHAAGDSPWGNSSDKWLNVHVHLSIVKQKEGSAQPLSDATPYCSAIFSGFIACLLPPYIVNHFIPTLYFYVFLSLCLYPEAKCPAVFPGWPAPSISSGSVSLCIFSLVMLSEQEISHSIRLKRSRSADKACAEGAPSPRCSICRPRLPPCLSTRDICIFPTISFPFSLSLCSLPHTRHISWFLSELSELHTYFPSLSNCFSFCSHTAISNKCPVKFYFYLALAVEDTNECSPLFICSQYSQFYLFYSQTFKRHQTPPHHPLCVL